MLILSLILLLLSTAITSRKDKSILYSRVTITILIISAFITLDNLDLLFLNNGIGVFGGLFHFTSITTIFQIFILTICTTISLLTSFYPRKVWLRECSSMDRLCFTKYNTVGITRVRIKRFIDIIYKKLTLRFGLKLILIAIYIAIYALFIIPVINNETIDFNFISNNIFIPIFVLISFPYIVELIKSNYSMTELCYIFFSMYHGIGNIYVILMTLCIIMLLLDCITNNESISVFEKTRLLFNKINDIYIIFKSNPLLFIVAVSVFIFLVNFICNISGVMIIRDNYFLFFISLMARVIFVKLFINIISFLIVKDVFWYYSISMNVLIPLYIVLTSFVYFFYLLPVVYQYIYIITHIMSNGVYFSTKKIINAGYIINDFWKYFLSLLKKLINVGYIINNYLESFLSFLKIGGLVLVKAIGTILVKGPKITNGLGKVLIYISDYSLNINVKPKSLVSVSRSIIYQFNIQNLSINWMKGSYFKGSLYDISVRNIKCLGGYSNLKGYTIMKAGHPWKILPNYNLINESNSIFKDNYMSKTNFESIGLVIYDNYARGGVFVYSNNKRLEFIGEKSVTLSKLNNIKENLPPLCLPPNNSSNHLYIIENNKHNYTLSKDINNKMSNTSIDLFSDILIREKTKPIETNLNIYMHNDIEYDDPDYVERLHRLASLSMINREIVNNAGESSSMPWDLNYNLHNQVNNYTTVNDDYSTFTENSSIMPNTVNDNISQNATIINTGYIGSIYGEQGASVHGNATMVQKINGVSSKYPCIIFGTSMLQNNKEVITLSFNLPKLQSDLKLDYLHNLCLTGRNYLININKNPSDTLLKDIIYNNDYLYSYMLTTVDKLYNYGDIKLAGEVCIFNIDFIKFLDDSLPSKKDLNSLMYDGEGSSVMAVPQSEAQGLKSSNQQAVNSVHLSNSYYQMGGPNNKNININNLQGSFGYTEGMEGTSYENINNLQGSFGYTEGMGGTSYENINNLQGSFDYTEGMGGTSKRAIANNTENSNEAALSTGGSRYRYKVYSKYEICNVNMMTREDFSEQDLNYNSVYNKLLNIKNYDNRNINVLLERIAFDSEDIKDTFIRYADNLIKEHSKAKPDKIKVHHLMTVLKKLSGSHLVSEYSIINQNKITKEDILKGNLNYNSVYNKFLNITNANLLNRRLCLKKLAFDSQYVKDTFIIYAENLIIKDSGAKSDDIKVHHLMTVLKKLTGADLVSESSIVNQNKITKEDILKGELNYNSVYNKLLNIKNANISYERFFLSRLAFDSQDVKDTFITYAKDFISRNSKAKTDNYRIILLLNLLSKLHE